MFEGAQQAYTGMLEGMNRQASRQIASASQDVRELSDEVIRLKRKTVAMADQIAQLSAVLQARDDADVAEVAAWRKEHPVSHMHDFVGKLRDGRGIRRNFAIWIAAFDATARRLGIANPEAHRIS